MRNLKEMIIESLLDDEDVILKNQDKNIKALIKQFLNDNYVGASSCKISGKPNENGKFVIDCKKGLNIKKKSITSLTNGYFEFGVVNGHFDCAACHLLTSLEGAPEKVGTYFACNYCDSLTSLEGAPKEVGKSFYCNNCKSLTSLEGAPKEIGGNFDYSNCYSIQQAEVDKILKCIKGKIIFN